MLTYKEIALTFKNARTEKDLPGIQKVYDYLTTRGIDREVADQLGLHIVPAMELIAAARRSPNVMIDTRAAVIFPHYSVADGEAVDWWSARMVDIQPTSPRLAVSFGDLVDPEKRRRVGKMFCPPNEPPSGYLCPLNKWAAISHGARVYIHESCTKAINGALLGKYSIGLNGVWGWSSSKHNIALIKELRDIPWKARGLTPCIVFDSNVETNWQVQLAESRLAAKLYEITGQQSMAFHVPKAADGSDQGFDDYRVTAGDRAALKFLEGPGVPLDISEFELMRIKLNSEVCVVRDLGMIAEQETGILMSRSSFAEVNYAHYMAEIFVGEDQTPKQVNVPRLWLTDERRIEVRSLDYMPGCARMHDGKLNLWHGMGVEPEPGPVDLWLELMANNIEEQRVRDWIISWLAWPLQNPGCKLNTLLLLFGPSGTGKGMFLQPVVDIYGANNGVMISNDQLKSQFNSLYAAKQFLHIDELERVKNEGSAVNQKIKLMTTSKRMPVNRKGDPEYAITNHLNAVITSNYHDCVKLDTDDRRMTVVKWEPLYDLVDHRGDQPYWRQYVDWTNNGGPAYLLEFLLGWDCKDFDPYAWALDTEWKREVTEAAMGPMEAWVHDLYGDPDNVLPATMGVGRALWTAKEISTLYYAGEDITQGRAMAMSHALGNRGFKQAAGGKPLKPQGRDGVQQRYWVIRDRKNPKWLDPKFCCQHLKLHIK